MGWPLLLSPTHVNIPIALDDISQEIVVSSHIVNPALSTRMKPMVSRSLCHLLPMLRMFNTNLLIEPSALL